MPDIAKLVTLDLAAKKLYIDGAEFPWWISEEGPTFGPLTDPRDVRRVTLTILADDVEIIPEGAEKMQAASEATDD
ncbi:hypothetical protein [Nocardia sp. NPDC051463]|uniref:hypothetical protein n=1 Tax=Nocardia sp. NPDC051463 TaxID=3154845 RepID=UPI00344E0F0F